MALRAFVPMPMALVVAEGSTGILSVPSERSAGMQTLTLGEQTVAIDEAYAADGKELLTRCESFAARFDLAEPFQRIREAIAETQLRGK
jgi:hypothetical protein